MFWHFKNLAGGETALPRASWFLVTNLLGSSLWYAKQSPLTLTIQANIASALNHPRCQATRDHSCSPELARIIQTSQSLKVYPALPCLSHGIKALRFLLIPDSASWPKPSVWCGMPSSLWKCNNFFLFNDMGLSVLSPTHLYKVKICQHKWHPTLPMPLCCLPLLCCLLNWSNWKPYYKLT